MESVRQELNRILGIVTVADNHLKVRTQLLLLLQDFTIRGIAIHDANIVATMLAYNIERICTLDNDFDRYRKHITILSPLTSAN